MLLSLANFLLPTNPGVRFQEATILTPITLRSPHLFVLKLGANQEAGLMLPGHPERRMPSTMRFIQQKPNLHFAATLSAIHINLFKRTNGFDHNYQAITPLFSA